MMDKIKNWFLVPKMKKISAKIFNLSIIAFTTAMLFVVVNVPTQILLTKLKAPQPQAILMLGGNIAREHFTLEFAHQHPELPIWVSSGSPYERQVLSKADLDSNRIHFDNRATDTVTNFTTTVNPLLENNIRHVYLITSDYHMRRSRAIATVVFGSKGIIVTPVSVSSQHPRERNYRVVRDVVRSFVWVFSGRTGASFNPRLIEQAQVQLTDPI